MRFALLGPVTVTGDSGPVSMPKVFPRSVLVALLLNANRVVSAERLIETLWGDRRPASATAALRNHVSRLRQFLGDADAERIHTEAPGYLIRIDPGDLDLDVFADLCAEGRKAARDEDWAKASRYLADALALWRGAPLADVPAMAGVEARIHQLHEDRLMAYEDRIEADLRLGRHGGIITDLRALIGEQPLREMFHQQLMLALYRSGRQAEALDAYRGLRRILVAELGVEPSPPLRELHHQILNTDPALAAPAQPSMSKPSIEAAPAQLPAAIRDFAGRQTIIQGICRLLQDGSAHGPAGPVVVSALTGIGGVGKTTLALHVGHRVAADYPDGLLYVGLGGAGDSPRGPGEVLAGMLRDLGEPDGTVPSGEDACAARFRSLTWGRRLLIILDDARDAAQVRPLLPGSGSCAVLVTSRNRLPGLVGAVPVHLDILTPQEALELFTSVVGAQRAGAEPESTQEVLNYCGGLPLAVRIVASRLAARPTWTVAALAARLSDERRRLDELRVEDIAVRVSFQMSYVSLSETGNRGGMSRGRAFRMLALVPGPDFTAHAAAALLDQSLEDAEELLEALVDANLLEAASPGRYRFHDLLLTFANELVRDEEAPAARREAAQRYVGWHLYAGHAAMLHLRKYNSDVDVAAAARKEPGLEFTDRQQAMAWYEAERFNLLAAVRLAAAERLGAAAWLLPRCLFSFYHLRGLWSDQLETADLGRASARDAGESHSEAALLNVLTEIHGRYGNVDLALSAGNEALRINESIGNRRGVAHNMVTVADMLSSCGRAEESFGWYRRAVDLFRRLEFPHELVLTLNNMGYAYCVAHRYGEALGPTMESLAIARELSLRNVEASALDTLGVAYHGLGSLDEAIEALRQAVAAFADSDDRFLGADSLDHLGEALLAAGRVAGAQIAWKQAAEWFQSASHPRADTIWDKLAALDSMR